MPARVPGTVRVVSWNLWWRFDKHERLRHLPTWQERQPAILATLQAVDADVVLLQEVWAEEGGRDQAAWLAHELGLRVPNPPARFRNGLSFRNAVLSRWPVASTATVTLPPTQVRTAVHAEIQAPFGPLHAISTHLAYEPDASAARSEQASALAALAASLHPGQDGFPVLVGGDLNATPFSDEVRLLTGHAPVPVPGFVLMDVWEQAGDGPGLTWASSNPHQVDATWPNRRLDYLFVGWPRRRPAGNPRQAFLCGTDAVDGVVPSDHYGVVADLCLPE
jgi:endonuclease/exonuclease/phosphatase family metal-dependent hydrolase